MNKYLAHFKTICKHKYYVAIECFKRGLIWQGIVHDLSKFSPTEFVESAKFFQGNKTPIGVARKELGYSIAWAHHKANNKHHWDYWLDIYHGELIPIPIPRKYLVEMVCDMKGAAKVYGSNNALQYFLDNEKYWIMTKENKEFIRHELEN